jgi:phosphoribosyl 1,2-cyclic phosphate phosphodiesterase
VKLTFLGTGTSHGIPSIGCRCAVCCSTDPRDARTRCAAVVQWGETHFLIDTPPEFRLQAIRSNVRRVDALLIPHTHADHLMGLDDVRRYNEMQEGELPIFARLDVLADVERVFQYVFVPTQAGGGKPRLRLIPVEGDEFEFSGRRVEAIPVLHGQLEVTAFRFGPLAYVTDVSAIPPASLERLRGLDTLVLGALRHEPHPTHFTVEQALAVVEELAPRRAFFIHMSHGLSHRKTNRQLPPRVRLAYDGLVVEIDESVLPTIG